MSSNLHEEMTPLPIRPANRDWATGRASKKRRLAEVAGLADGKRLPTRRIAGALRTLVRSGDRVFIKGNNQKQADFLSRSLADLDPSAIGNLCQFSTSSFSKYC
ncbi:malonate decarboxylase alpha subunit [Halopolyspora algeriensis]|uniref:Malonate decarboxylase alpha subunit n=1 Tax=Halopolyspora algeriensis TaxID=1500506 RepID=A0A368VUU4_9ACTN|nr:malonate decarboxylase subunit alpha [Halopolyspora algeriensis]RCW45866.1 malonate decarboxylase alpha subunit [Halopolyspora algeriensis]TQM55280.1 malonate decarboxylase alpha subunit [Halopolyspora algeriensis]